MSDPTSTFSIEADGLSKSFGELVAVEKASFSVRPGEVVGFIGPNGAGKSTTLRMLTGFLRPSSGKARIGGYDVLRQPMAARRRFGYLPETGPLYGEMTVIEFLRFVAGARGMDRLALDGDLNRVRKICHLEKVWHQTIETLSKGYRQRVGLAQAILHDPSCLILDEPTDGLDPNQKQEVRDLVTEMGREKAILLSTHVLEELEAVCDRVILLHRGKVLLDEAIEAMRRRHPLFGSVRIRVAPGDADRAPKVFTKLKPFVSRVDRQGDDFLLHSRDQQNVSEAVLSIVKDSGLDLREMAPVIPRLEDVFQELTRSTSKFTEEVE
ncbi:MAG: ATP-binding cassette domain-containing protein [Puniceicoccales bacterium]